VNNKFDNFMNALEELCREHDVGINLNESETLEIYDLGADDCEVFCNMIFED